MAPGTEPLSPLGRLLESTRTHALRLSAREAARRAGISEGRWRQIVKGQSTTDRTIVAMALAVGLDPGEALATAGATIAPEHLAALVADVQKSIGPTTSRASDDALANEIERIRSLPMSPESKQRMISALIDVYEEATQQASPGRQSA